MSGKEITYKTPISADVKPLFERKVEELVKIKEELNAMDIDFSCHVGPTFVCGNTGIYAITRALSANMEAAELVEHGDHEGHDECIMRAKAAAALWVKIFPAPINKMCEQVRRYYDALVPDDVKENPEAMIGRMEKFRPGNN